jgi:hypothetical protein
MGLLRGQYGITDLCVVLHIGTVMGQGVVRAGCGSVVCTVEWGGIKTNPGVLSRAPLPKNKMDFQCFNLSLEY